MEGIAVVEDFPQHGSLSSTAVKVPSMQLLSPVNVCVWDDKLIFLERQTEYLLDVISLPGLDGYYTTGFRGRGPNELVNANWTFFEPSYGGLNLLDSDVFLKKAIITEDSVFRVVDTKEFKKNLGPMNGFVRVAENRFFMLNQPTDPVDAELVILDNEKGETEKTSPYPNLAHNSDVYDYEVYYKNGVSRPDGARVAYFYTYFKHFRIYDSNDGSLLKDVSVNIEPYSKSFETETDSRLMAYKRPSATQNYIYAICSNRTVGDTGSLTDELQVWDWDGNPVASYTLDKRVSLYDVSEKYGKLYATTGYVEDSIYVFDLPVF